MEKANCVSKAIEVINRNGEVHLDSYWITSMMLRVELNKLGVEFTFHSIDKWNHIFIATNQIHKTTSKLEEVIEC